MWSYATHSSLLQDMMWCYATHSSLLQDMMWCYAMGWGVIAFVTTARHDVMLRYAFVTTARHDGRLRYAWGGVGCDSIRHYCKTWCDATLRIRHYCKTWWEATLRMGWGGVGCDSIRHYCKTWWEATLRMMGGYGTLGYWKLMKKSIPDSIRSQVQGKRNGLLFKYIRSHQWRWEHTDFDLLTATGEAVRSLMRWREKTTLIVRRVLKHKTLQGLQTTLKRMLFFMAVSHMKSSWRHSETRIFKQSWAGARSAG